MSDKRSEDGTLLTYEAKLMSSEISKKCVNEIKNIEIYKLLYNFLDNDLVDFYFTRYIYLKIFPIISKLLIFKTDRKSDPDVVNIPIELSNFPWIDIFIKYWPDQSIQFKVNNSYLVKKSFAKSIKESIIKNTLIYFNKMLSLVLLKNKKYNFQNYSSIAVNYCDGIDINKRSDIFWYKNSEIKPESILIYFESPKQLNNSLIKKINKMGFNWCVIKPYANFWKNINNSWFDSFRTFNPKIREIKKKIQSIKTQTDIEYWLKEKSIFLLDKTDLWYEFFFKHQSKIHIDAYEDEEANTIKSLAIDLIGGCSIGKEKGIMVAGEGYFGYYPHHIFFTWGKRSAKYYLQSTNIHKNILISGYPYSINKSNKNSINDIKTNNKLTLLVLDNAHSLNNSHSVQCIYSPVMEKFYKKLLYLVLDNKSISLIIKSKKPEIINELSSISYLFDEAESTGRCFIDSNSYGNKPGDYSQIIDFVLSTGVYFSTALCELIINGKRGLFFDYPNLESYEKDLYKIGKDKIIFRDLDKMMLALNNYINKPKKYPEIGDWSNIASSLDPYSDNQGSSRIGEYIRILSNNLNQSLGHREAIKLANNYYSQKYGSDKVFYTKYN